MSALRSYGRLPTARPPGVSSGRLFSSPSVRSASLKLSEDDEQTEGGAAPSGGLSQRPRRSRKPTSASPASRALPAAPGSDPPSWHAALHLAAGQGSATTKPAGGLGPAAQLQQQLTSGSGSAGAAAGADGIKPEPLSVADLARAQQAQLQALSAALMGAGAPLPSTSAAVSGASGGPGPAPAPAPTPRPPSAKAASALLLGGPGSAARLASFEGVLNRVMACSHELRRPDEAPGESSGGRPLHSGPKGQSGFKGVTLYKWVVRSGGQCVWCEWTERGRG